MPGGRLCGISGLRPATSLSRSAVQYSTWSVRVADGVAGASASSVEKSLAMRGLRTRWNVSSDRHIQS